MLPANKTIKRQSRQMLRKNWPGATAVVLIFSTVYLILALGEELVREVAVTDASASALKNAVMGRFEPLPLALDGAFLLLSFFFMFPLMLGIFRFFLQLAGDVRPAVSEVFFHFSTVGRLARAAGIGVLLWLRWFVISFIMLLPVNVTFLLTDADVANKLGFTLFFENKSWIEPFAGLMSVALYLSAMLVMSRYFLVLTVANSRPELSAAACFKPAVRMSKGSRGAIIALVLGFLGWMLLCIFVMPLLFVMPYMFTSWALFSLFMIEGKSGPFEKEAPAHVNAPENIQNAWPTGEPYGKAEQSL